MQVQKGDCWKLKTTVIQIRINAWMWRVVVTNFTFTHRNTRKLKIQTIYVYTWSFILSVFKTPIFLTSLHLICDDNAVENLFSQNLHLAISISLLTLRMYFLKTLSASGVLYLVFNLLLMNKKIIMSDEMRKY